MYYSLVGSIAILILLIENMDVLTGRISDADAPTRKTYRWFLYAVLFYYITDVLWGVIESSRIAGLLFADTTVYFIAMAAGLVLWTRFVALYLEDETYFGKFLVWAGRVCALALALLSVLNIFVPVLFVVSPDCVYRALGPRYVMLGIQIIILLLVSGNALATTIRRQIPKYRRRRYRAIVAFGFTMAFFLSAQIAQPYLPLYAIAYMLGTCMIRTFVIGEVLAGSKHELAEAEKVLKLQESITSLMDNMPGMSFSKDAGTGVYLACNQAFADYAHKESPEDVVGLTDFEIFDPKTAAHFVEDDRKALAIDKPYVFVEDVPDASGKAMKIQTTKVRFTDEQGRTCVLGLCQDMTEQMRLRQESERIEEEHIAYERINALIGDFLCLYIVDPVSGNYREYSKSKGFRQYALPESGSSFFDVAHEYAGRYIYPDDLNLFVSTFTKENVMKEIGKRGVFSISFRFLMDSKPVHVRLRAAFVVEKEGMRLIVGVNNIEATVRQEEEYSRSLAQAQTKASVDALTGVKNRHSYLAAEEDLDRRIIEGIAPSFAIAMLDVNDLKKVNDSLGHSAGDQLIRDACKVICDTFSHSPVFRVGGDEFVVISQGSDYDHMDELVVKIREHNKEAKKSGGPVLACGMSRYMGDDTAEAVFERADHAMYEDKAKLKGEKLNN